MRAKFRDLLCLLLDHRWEEDSMPGRDGRMRHFHWCRRCRRVDIDWRELVADLEDA